MKKLIAMVLLSLYLFSLSAGLLAYAVAAYSARIFFEKQTSRGLYNVNDLTEVSIPADLPGIADQVQYSKVFGEVRFADAAYNYVGIKVTQQALYLLCVPNYCTTRLCGQNIINVMNMRGVPVNPKNHVPAEKALNLNVFNYHTDEYEFAVPSRNVFIRPGIIKYDVLKSSLSQPGEPPEKA